MEPSINKSLIEPNVDFSLPKVIGVGALGVILAGAMGYFLRAWLDFKGTDSLQPLLTFVLAIVVFLAVFVLQTLFLKSKAIVNSVIILESLALAAPFLGYFSWYVLAAWLLALLNFLNASFRGRSEMDNQLRIKFFRIKKPVVSRALTALSLFIALIYFNGPNAGADFGISKQTIKSFLKPSEPILQRTLIKNFSFDMSMYQFVDAALGSQIAGKLGISAEAIPQAMRAPLINQGIAQLRAQLAPYGINFRNNDTITDILYNYLSKLVVQIPETFRPLITIGGIFLVFLVFRSFGFLFHWAAGALSYVLYEAAMLSGFARLTLESRSREIILLK